MKIAFYQPHLDIQGTGVSYYDYALYNERILGNKSFMIYDKDHPGSHPLAINKFKSNIDTIALDGREDMSMLESTLCKIDADAVYIQKCGLKNDGRYVNNKPMLIHVVGVNNDPHGLVYAYVSQWLSDHCSHGKHPTIPYIINLPDIDDTVNFRNDLNIPSDAIVFGRIGGYYSWNVPFVSQSVIDTLSLTPNVYFLFVQTHKFVEHPRVIYLDAFADLNIKRKFINTCDAFLHARQEGESFGAAVGEFSSCNKPVITYADSPERNHIFQLKEKGIYYNSLDSLKRILTTFKPDTSKDWNAYKDFTPNKVMQQFDKVFLDKVRNNAN